MKKRLFGTVGCRQASELLSRKREGSLKSPERVALLVHLAMCVNCRRYSRQIRILGRAFRAALDQEGNEGS